MRILFLASFGGSLNLVDDIRGSWAGRQEATSSRQPFFLSFQRPFWCFIALLFPAEVIHLVYKKRPQPQKSNSTFQNSYWQKRCKKNHAATGLWRSKHMSATACAAIILVVLLLWPVASSSSNSWARGRTSPHQWGSSRGCWDRQKASSNFFSDLKCHSITLNYPRRCYQVMNDAVATWKKRALEES